MDQKVNPSRNSYCLDQKSHLIHSFGIQSYTRIHMYFACKTEFKMFYSPGQRWIPFRNCFGRDWKRWVSMRNGFLYYLTSKWPLGKTRSKIEFEFRDFLSIPNFDPIERKINSAIFAQVDQNSGSIKNLGIQFLNQVIKRSFKGHTMSIYHFW